MLEGIYIFVVSLHIILCVILVLIILLQPGKGGDVGSAFGGGSSSSMFGPRGPASLLSRATTGAAVLFMVTSMLLALYSNRAFNGDKTVTFDDDGDTTEGPVFGIQKQEKEESTSEEESSTP